MALNLSPMPSLKISSYTSNSIARRNRIAASTYAVGTKSRSKTIPCQKGRVCAPEACMASWLPRRNYRASRERGRITTSRSSGEWSLSCRTARPLLTSRKFRGSQVALRIVTKDYPARSICREVKTDTSLFGTSRLRHLSDPVGEMSRNVWLGAFRDDALALFASEHLQPMEFWWAEGCADW